MLFGTLWTAPLMDSESDEQGTRAETKATKVITLLDPICVSGRSDDGSDSIEIDYLKQIQLVFPDGPVEFPDSVTGAAWGKLVRADPDQHRFKALFVVDRYLAAD